MCVCVGVGGGGGSPLVYLTDQSDPVIKLFVS